MGFFSSVADPGGVFGGESLQDSLLGDPAGDAAKAQIAQANKANNLQRRQFNTLREDAAPLRELRNENLSGINRLLGLEGSADNSAFFKSPEFQNVNKAASSVANGERGPVRDALLKRAGSLAGGESGNFTNRLFTLAGIGADGLNSTNSQLQGNINNQAQLLNDVGQSAAEGIIGQANNNRDLAATGLSALLAFSDPRLKTNIKKVGEIDSGLGWYTWDWKNPIDQPSEGVMATEVKDLIPDAVHMINGYMAVDMGMV